MNEMTLFWAQIFGPLFGVVGLGMLINQDFYTKMFKDFTKETAGLLATTMIMIAIGIVMAMKHFLWSSLPEILISAIGIAFLVKGIFLAIMPRAFGSIRKSLLSKTIIVSGGIIWIIGGMYLSWVGFFN